VRSFGLREEMKQAYGLGWREHVRGVTTTLDVVENLAFHERIRALLGKLDQQYQGKIDAGHTLDPGKALAASSERKMPDVIVVAANARGEIVRYFEAGVTASVRAQRHVWLLRWAARNAQDRLHRQNAGRDRHRQCRERSGR
jgi:hypothetical protein